MISRYPRSSELAAALFTVTIVFSPELQVSRAAPVLSEVASPAYAAPVQSRIAVAMSGGPANVANAARIVDLDASGKTIVLREGHNGFTCMPAHGDVSPTMCADEASMQWMADFAARKPKPTNTVPGITYMLAGATQRSDSDPWDTTSPLIRIGPHWMILWPFDPNTTGLPNTHKATGAYVMWAGSPYAHLHVMGRP
jgi:hypothetical protein